MLFIFILSFHPTLFSFTFHVGRSVQSSCYFLASFFLFFFFFFCLIKPPENSRIKDFPFHRGALHFIWESTRWRTLQQKRVRVVLRVRQGHSKPPTAIISWLLHLKRCLRLVPRAEANFKHLVATLAKGGLIWKPPCGANPGVFGLGDENREALINCVWWWVCECVYWKIGSVTVTTLATASYFVGLAGTTVNKKNASPSRKVFKRASNQMRTLLLGLRKYRQATAGEGPFSCLLALWHWSSCTFQTNSQRIVQPTDAEAFREAKNCIPLWWETLDLGGRESQSHVLKLLLLSTDSGSHLFCCLGTFHQSGAKMQRVSLSPPQAGAILGLNARHPSK